MGKVEYQVLDNGTVVQVVYHDDGTMSIGYLGKVDKSTGQVVDVRSGYENELKKALQSTGISNTTNTNVASSSTPSSSSASTGHRSTRSSPPSSHVRRASPTPTRSTTSSLKPPRSDTNIDSWRPKAYTIVKYNGKYYAYSPIRDAWVEADAEGHIYYNKQVTDPNLNKQLFEVAKQKGGIVPEKKAAEQLLEKAIGSVGYTKKIGKLSPGTYKIVTSTGEFEVNVFQDKIKYKTKFGETGEITYDPKKAKAFVKSFENEVKQFQEQSEQLKKQIEAHNKKVEEFNKLVESLKNPTPEQLKQLQQKRQELLREEQELKIKVQQLQEKQKRLLVDLPKYKTYGELANLDASLDRIATEEQMIKLHNDILIDVQKEVVNKKQKAYELAKKKFEEQLHEGKLAAEGGWGEASKTLGWAMHVPLPWATTTAKIELQKFFINTGIKELENEIDDPEVRYFAEKYYRKMAYQANKELDKLWEKSMVYETGITAVGAAIGMAADYAAVQLGAYGLRALPIKGVEYLATTYSDIVLQKELFGKVDVPTTLLMNSLVFLSLPTKETVKVREPVKIEEFRFRELEPHFEEFRATTVIKTKAGSVAESFAEYEELSKVGRGYYNTIKSGIKDIQEKDGPYLIDKARIYKELGVYDDSSLYKRVVDVTDNSIQILEDYKAPKKTYEVEVKLEGSEKWQKINKLLLKDEGDTQFGVLSGEIEIEKEGKTYKAKILSPQKIEVYENAEATLVGIGVDGKQYKYNPITPDIDTPATKIVFADKEMFPAIEVKEEVPTTKTGRLIKQETPEGTKFFEWDITKKYGKQITRYKEIGAEKGMTVVYDEETKRGFGIDPTIELERSIEKQTTKPKLDWFFGDTLLVEYEKDIIKPRSRLFLPPIVEPGLTIKNFKGVEVGNNNMKMGSATPNIIEPPTLHLKVPSFTGTKIEPTSNIKPSRPSTKKRYDINEMSVSTALQSPINISYSVSSVGVTSPSVNIDLPSFGKPLDIPRPDIPRLPYRKKKTPKKKESGYKLDVEYLFEDIRLY